MPEFANLLDALPQAELEEKFLTPKHGAVLSSGPWQGPPAVPGGEGAWHRDGQRPREIFFAPSDKSATKSFAVRPSELFSSGETAVTSHWGDPIQNWW
jgi:hypothetical protein